MKSIVGFKDRTATETSPPEGINGETTQENPISSLRGFLGLPKTVKF